MVVRHINESDFAARHILLVPNRLVTREKHIKARNFCRTQQGSVPEFGPAQLSRALHFVRRKKPHQRPGHVLIQQNLQDVRIT